MPHPPADAAAEGAAEEEEEEDTPPAVKDVSWFTPPPPPPAPLPPLLVLSVPLGWMAGTSVSPPPPLLLPPSPPPPPPVPVPLPPKDASTKPLPPLLSSGCFPITVRREVEPGASTRGAVCSDLLATAWRAGFMFRDVKVRGLAAAEAEEEEEEGVMAPVGLAGSLIVVVVCGGCGCGCEGRNQAGLKHFWMMMMRRGGAMDSKPQWVPFASCTAATSSTRGLRGSPSRWSGRSCG